MADVTRLYRERCTYNDGRAFRWTGRRQGWFHWHIGVWHVGLDK